MKNFFIAPDEKFIREVRPVIINALKKCEKIFKPKKKIQISISHTDDPFVIKQMGGSSGVTFSGTLISINMNTKVKSWRRALFSTVAHEYSHAIRAQFGHEYNSKYTILDHVASEGLGQCFEEFMSGATPPWAKAISYKKAKYFWQKMKPHLKKPDWDLRDRIFLRDDKKVFPQWCGYTVSYLIVKKKVAELNCDWKRLIGMSSREIVGKGLR